MPFFRIWACVAFVVACLLGCTLLLRLNPAEAQTLPSASTIQSVLGGSTTPTRDLATDPSAGAG